MGRLKNWRQVIRGVIAAMAATMPTLHPWAVLAENADGAVRTHVAQLLHILLDGPDAEFEALRDRCIRVAERRICPGADVEPDAEAPPAGQVPGISHTERGVSFVPGVKGDDTPFSALEDLLRLAVEEDRLVDAADKAGQLRAFGQCRRWRGTSQVPCAHW